MPNRCMVPCNPVCCAMCFHQDAGRGDDAEHKQGSIFANAASVLSMAAEEISLDDHLEKELANEVELWRMETSSTAVHTNDGAYRTVFAPLDQRDKYGYGGSIETSSALDSPRDGMDSDNDDLTDSLGDSHRNRGRGSSDFAYTGGRPRIAPHYSGGALGGPEDTTLTTESTGMSAVRHDFPNTPVTESREETATSSNANWGYATVPSRSATEDVHAGIADAMARQGIAVVPPGVSPARASGEGIDMDNGSPTAAVHDAASATFATPRNSRENLEHFDPNRVLMWQGPSPAEIPASSPADPNSPPPRGMVPPAPKGSRQPQLDPNAPRDDKVSLPRNLAPISGACAEIPNKDEAPPHDNISQSSSSEDSFPGFIEDPLEKEMQAPGPDDMLHRFRRPDQTMDSQAAHVWAAAPAEVQGVRSDRSHF